MKKTKYIKQIQREKRKYEFFRFLSYLRIKLSFGKRKKQNEFAHYIFDQDFNFHEYDNSLPQTLYYKPTDIIIYDLIRKEDLQSTQKGLIYLFKQHFSHKFIGGANSEQDIEKIIKGLDLTIHSGNSWYRTSVFDFANKDKLDIIIDHFEIYFHNFSSSYAAVEMRLVLSDYFVDELSQFIKKQYKESEIHISRIWGRNRRKTGSRILYGIGSNMTSEQAKSQIIYEQLEYVKKTFLKIIKRYLPLLQYSKNKDIIAINVFDTNISPSMTLERSVYSGLGINDMNGFFFSKDGRLYTSTETVATRHNQESDMMYIYNGTLITDYHGPINSHNKALTELTMCYMKQLYKAIILTDMGVRYLNLISIYRNKVNKCKNNKKQHKKLLKIQYELNRDFYDFKKIDEELPVDETLLKLKTILEDNKWTKASIHNGYHTYEQFTDYPKWIWKQIRRNYTEVENDLKHKVEISDSLLRYSNERKNRGLIIFQVVIAIMSMLLIVFPTKAQEIAAFIKGVYRSICSFIH